MSIRQKTTQHKPTREDRQTKEMRDLEAQVKSLRKQLARQRKRADKAFEPVIVVEDGSVETPDKSTNECPKCGSPNMRSMTLPTGTLLVVCKDCGERTKK